MCLTLVQARAGRRLIGPALICLAIAASLPSAASSAAAPRTHHRANSRTIGPKLLLPRRFKDGAENQYLLAAIARGMDKGITFDRHYSAAYVSCGVRCGSYWFVDRRSGVVIELPERSASDQIVYDFNASRTSNIVRVVYGPRDGVGQRCEAQSFRLTPSGFKPFNRRSVACPR